MQDNSLQGFGSNWDHQKTKEATSSIEGQHAKAIDLGEIVLECCRATLEEPDGFCKDWLRHWQSTPIRFKRQQGGSGIIFWVAMV